MQLPWDEHFCQIVIPAWQAYLTAENQLTQAVRQLTEREDIARYRVLREAGAAIFYLHHFADIVMRARPAWLPDRIDTLGKLRLWLAEHCTMLRSNIVVDDVMLLRDVADALKHVVLTYNLDSRHVSANEAVLVVGRNYDQLRFGEGKYGGTPSVLVLTHSEPRALTSILQNVTDAWRRCAGIALPEIGAP